MTTIKISGINGLREAELLEDLGGGKARVRFLDGGTRTVQTRRIVGWSGSSAPKAEPPLPRAKDRKPSRALAHPGVFLARDLERATPRPVRAAPKPDAPLRDGRYLAFVRRRPCLLCGAPAPSHAHHHGRRGLGQKTDDYRTIPLCARDHDAYHAGLRPELSHERAVAAQLDLLIDYLRDLASDPSPDDRSSP